MLHTRDVRVGAEKYQYGACWLADVVVMAMYDCVLDTKILDFIPGTNSVFCDFFFFTYTELSYLLGKVRLRLFFFNLPNTS